MLIALLQEHQLPQHLPLGIQVLLVAALALVQLDPLDRAIDLDIDRLGTVQHRLEAAHISTDATAVAQPRDVLGLTVGEQSRALVAEYHLLFSSFLVPGPAVVASRAGPEVGKLPLNEGEVTPAGALILSLPSLIHALLRQHHNANELRTRA